jgi:hypothetical protein
VSSDDKLSRQLQSFGNSQKRLFNYEISRADITKIRNEGQIMETHVPVNMEKIQFLDVSGRSHQALYTRLDNSVRYFKQGALSVEENLVSSQNRGFTDE